MVGPFARSVNQRPRSWHSNAVTQDSSIASIFPVGLYVTKQLDLTAHVDCANYRISNYLKAMGRVSALGSTLCRFFQYPFLFGAC